MSKRPNPLPAGTELVELDEDDAPGMAMKGPPDIGLGLPVGRAMPIPVASELSPNESLTAEDFAPEGTPAPRKPLSRTEFLAKYPPPANTRSWAPRQMQTPAERRANANAPAPPVGKLA
jgi:hypothetical protein